MSTPTEFARNYMPNTGSFNHLPKITMLALSPDAGTSPVPSLEAEVEMVANKLGASVLYPRFVPSHTTPRDVAAVRSTR